MLPSRLITLHMNDMPPFDPSNPDGKVTTESSHGVSDATSQPPLNQIADMLKDPGLQRGVPCGGLSQMGDVDAHALNKRQLVDSWGGQQDSKRRREEQGRRVNEQTNMELLLGRAWGPNIQAEPTGMNEAIRSMLQQQESQQNSTAHFNDIGAIQHPGAPTGGLLAQDFSGMGQNNQLLSMNETALRQAEISAQFLREEAFRNQQAAANAMLLYSHRGLDPSLMTPTPLPWGNQLPTTSFAQPQQYPGLHSLAQLDSFRQASSVAAFMGQQQPPEALQDYSSLLRQINAVNSGAQSANFTDPSTHVATMNSTTSALPARDAPQHSNPQNSLELPPCVEGSIVPYMSRTFVPLGIDEDPNWLSEFHCFVRSELIEVFRASYDDVKSRNNAIAYKQVGVRCRFCAHMTPSARAGRSSAFPSSLRQIYQSFTMMLRDHFGNCEAMPTHMLDRFVHLKDKPTQGATDSKRYWIYSAMKIGMTDSTEGIICNETTRINGASSPPFGTCTNQKWEDDALSQVTLVQPTDRPLISDFLYVLMSNVQPIRLTEVECIGNRRSLRVGLPGFGCRYCCENRRLGLCRMFPARRRTLPIKVADLYDHLRRCSVCPHDIKEHLERTKHQINMGFNADQGGDREFFDRVWSRLGHEGQAA